MEVSSATEIQADKTQVIHWFETLQDYPERYRFATHGGVEVVAGSLDQPGAIFETQEQFLGVSLRLRFKLVKVKKDAFVFQLVKPMGAWQIKGEFQLKQLAAKITGLRLRIFGKKKVNLLTKILQGLLFISPIKWLIKRQIRAEVAFIRQAVEKN